MPHRSHLLIRFRFEGDDLDVVRLDNGDVGLPLRPLSELFELDPEGQRQRLARAADAGARWACTCIMQVQVGGQRREMVILPRRSIPMWAATVDVARVAPRIRQKLVVYQDKVADVLADHFLDAGIVRRVIMQAHADLRDPAHSGLIGKPRARSFILGYIRDATALYCQSVGDASRSTFLREFRDREDQVRLHVGFPRSLGQRWENLPIARFGDAVNKALEILARDRRRRSGGPPPMSPIQLVLPL